MIVTHTQNAAGQRRVYIGGKGSLECWIDPKTDGYGWTFHLAEAVTGNPLSRDEQHAWAMHTLVRLADALDVHPQDLSDTPFEAIAALHSNDPFEGRRIATPRRKALDQAFVSTTPTITRPKSDFVAAGYSADQRRPR